MSHSNFDTSEIIMAGFSDTYAASLVHAALARLQAEFGLTMHDVAIVVRTADGNIAVQQTIRRNAGRTESSTFWETLTDQLFAPEASTGTATVAASGQGAAVGINKISARGVANQLRSCRSFLLVRVRGTVQTEKVVGVLQGFDGELVRVPFEF